MRQYGNKWSRFVCFIKNRHTFHKHVGVSYVVRLSKCAYCEVDFRGTSYGSNTTTGPIRKAPL